VDKLDKSIIDMMKSAPKFDGKMASVLTEKPSAKALVRVRNPLHFGLLERNFKVSGAYPFIRSVVIDCELKDAIKLERMQEVEYVSAQGKVLALDSENDTKSQKTPLNAHFSAQAAAQNEENEADIHKSEFSAIVCADGRKLDGDGVTLCVMDTGISPHLDLSVPSERILHFEDFIGNESEPYDDNGHGTFVAGVACGNGLLSGKRIAGVAPRANMVGIKVIGSSGESGTFKILDGMQWLFDNYRQYGIKVVCMSFGADPLSYADPLKLGAEMLARSGLIVVAASGNSGENTLKSPAISNEVIAVGAVNESGEVANFTSRGVYQGSFRPDVFANGVEVKGISAGGTYSVMSGTSAAAPYVAGACCLLCQKYKSLTPRQAKNMIVSSSHYVNGNRVFEL